MSKRIYLVIHLFIFLLFVPGLSSDSNHSFFSKSFRTYQAAKHAYFLDMRALPIFYPHTGNDMEVPGDIYIDSYHGFIARNNLCFSETDYHDSTIQLPEVLDTSNLDLEGGFTVPYKKIVDLSIELGIAYEAESTLEFSDENMSYYEQFEISRALDNAPQDCLKTIGDILDRSDGYTFQERIPWILRDVLYANEEAKFTFSNDNSAGLTVEFSKEIREFIDTQVNFGFDSSSDGEISINTEEPIPVAYRPAFISVEDFERINSIDEDTWRMVRRWVFGDRYDRAQLDAIQGKFPDIFNKTPDEITKQMTSGTTGYFLSEDFYSYIDKRNLSFIVAWETNCDCE